MKQIIPNILILLIIFLFSYCNKKNKAVLEYETDWSIPANRSFRMGFTAFPYDITPQAVVQSYVNQSQNGDILLTHFDHGVPWNEALNNLPFPTEVETAINEAVANRTPTHKVFLTATATDTERDKLAKYWNNSGTQQPLPAAWSNKSFNSPEVITAYKNYCRRIINTIQPDYFAFGIEINSSFLKNTQAYKDYLEFADTIYHSLKLSYPNIPILLTFQDQSFNKSKTELLQLTSELLAFSDMIAISSYPFWNYTSPERDANPRLFANNWLADLRQLAPNKPFAISETGFAAENLSLPGYGVSIKSNETWQREYVQKLLAESNRLNAVFVIWFVYRDYDLLERNLPNASEALKIWRDNGLQNGSGNNRPAHSVWNDWKKLQIR
jgi:hypothetical protein